MSHSQQLNPITLLDPEWLFVDIFIEYDQELARWYSLQDTPQHAFSDLSFLELDDSDMHVSEERIRVILLNLVG